MKLKSRLESDVFSSILIQNEEPEYNKHILVKLMETTVFQLLLLVITFYSLFFDDYQQLICGKQLDSYFDVFSITIMSIFAIELVVSSLFIKGYFNSYFFYLDLISTLSIIVDLNMFKNVLNTSFSSGSNSIARIGKLVRLVRLIRLFRISRIYKSFSKSKISSAPRKINRLAKHAKAVRELQRLDAFNEPRMDATGLTLGKISTLSAEVKQKVNKVAHKDSKVGKKISEVATKTVILMVFILLILLPIFNADFWTDTGYSGSAYCQEFSFIINQSSFKTKSNLTSIVYFEEAANFDPTNQTAMLHYITKTVKINMQNLALGKLLRVKFAWRDIDYYYDADYSLRRYEEMIITQCTANNDMIVIIYQDDATYALLASGLNILRTIYICLALLGGSYLFSSNAQRLVIVPIERMIEKAANVIQHPQEIKEEAFIEQEEKEHKAYMNSIEGKLEELDNNDNFEGKQLETMFLEEAISKISVLLGVGLGDAGSELIYNYLKNEKDILNIATEIEAIFGFCDIRNFTDATEVLQEEVMIFVNTIAEIVHSLADMSLGAANKNVGDAFLVVWRIRPEDALPINKNQVDMSHVWSNIADLALFAVLCMHAEMGRNYELKRFVEKEEMQARIGKNFRVRLGFGLHFGWSIEGALGSLFKIDATYLSPHVNMAARLEGDTKIYGIPILMSGEFFDLLSLPVKIYCRQVDSIGGYERSPALRLYSPLVTDKHIKYTHSNPVDRHIQKTKERSNFKKVIRYEIHNGRLIGKRIFQNSQDVSMLVSSVDHMLVRHYRKGYDEFKDGRWTKAKEEFTKVLEIDPKDGPSLFLMAYMKEMMFKKPDWWNGSRKA